MDSGTQRAYIERMNADHKPSAALLPDALPELLPELLIDEPCADHVLLLCVDDTRDDALGEALRTLASQTDFAVQCHTLAADAPAALPEMTSRHYVCILTSALADSLALLRHALHSPARYIGLAAQNGAALLDALRGEGVPPAELACLRCPAGLPIGAVTAPERAVAILAEVIAARAGRMPRPSGRAKYAETP